MKLADLRLRRDFSLCLLLCPTFRYQKVMGTPVQSIKATEDRDVFNQKLAGESVAYAAAVVIFQPCFRISVIGVSFVKYYAT